MSVNIRIGCSGRFRFSPFFDVTLSEQFRIPTPEVRNFRIVQVPFSDSSRRVVAVGGSLSPFPVGVYDVNSKQQICRCLGHRSQIRGLTSLCETISSNPIIVSGGKSDSQLLIFDAINGSKLGPLANPPRNTYRLLHVPEWNNSDVFVGGNSGFHGRYDIRRNRKIGGYKGHKSGVYGLSGLVSRNVLISASYDNTVRLWSRDEYSCQNVINVSDGPLSCCSVSENLIVVGLQNGSVEVWDVRRLAESVVGLTRVGGGYVWDVAVIDESRGVLCGCNGGALAVLEPSTGRVSARTKLESTVAGVCVLGNSSGSPSRSGDVSSVPVVAEQIESSNSLFSSERISTFRGGDERSSLQVTSTETERDAQIVQLQQAVAEKDTQLRRITHQKDTQIAELRRTNAEQQRRNDAVAAEFRANTMNAERRIRDLQESGLSKDTELEAKNDENAELRERVETMETENAALRVRVEASDSKMAELRARIASSPNLHLLPHVAKVLSRLVEEESLSLDPSASFAKRGILDLQDVLWSREQNRGRQFRVAFSGVDDGSEEVIVLDIETDEELQQHLIRVCSSGDSSSRTTSVGDQFSDLYEQWNELCAVEIVTPDVVAMTKHCLSSMLKLIKLVTVRTCEVFGGELSEIREECARKLSQHSPSSLGSLIGAGLGRHRVLFFKLAMDYCEIPCRLLSGKYNEELRVWAVPRLGDQHVIVDFCRSKLTIIVDPTGYVLPSSLTDVARLDVAALGEQYRSMSCPQRLTRIGRGTFGDVFEMPFRDSISGFVVSVAVKEIDLEDVSDRCRMDYRSHFLRELHLMREMDHPNILKLMGSFAFRRGGLAGGRIPTTASGGGYSEGEEWNLNALFDLLHLSAYSERFEEEDVVLRDLERLISRDSEFVEELIPSQIPRERLVRFVREHHAVLAGQSPPSASLSMYLRSSGQQGLSEFLLTPELSSYEDNFRAEGVVLMDLSHLDDAILRRLVPRRGARLRFQDAVDSLPPYQESGVPQQDAGSSVGREREIMCLAMKRYTCSGDGIIRLLRVLQLQSSDAALLEVLLILLQVAMGLRYLHSLSMLHLDLKPANVLIDWDATDHHVTSVVLCDFGGAKEKRQTYIQTTTVMGTREISAPEVRAKRAFDERADIYSFGCLMRSYSEFFDRFFQLSELSIRCQSEDPNCRPSLIEILSVLESHVMFVNQQVVVG